MKTIIQTYATNLNQMLTYYNKLEFEHITVGHNEYVVSNKFAIQLNTNNKSRPGLNLYLSNIKETETALSNHLNCISSENSFLVTTPSGCKVYAYPETDAPTIELASNESALGNFMGMSLETTDIQKSILIWEILGFKIISGKVEQGWVLLMNDNDFGISLMAPNACPHRCIIPSLTFFNNTKNPEIIRNIRNIGIPIAEEITAFNKEEIVDNIIIQDPGGLGFFIFND